MERRPITREGFRRLQEELQRLKRVDRAQNIREIAEARAHGDISENAEYQAAKERQSFIEGRIRELEHRLATAQIIDPGEIRSDKVVFGATVRVLDLERDEEREYTLVGEDEADVENGRISIRSPVARALLGHKVGDVVTVQVPAGQREYEILEIRFE